MKGARKSVAKVLRLCARNVEHGDLSISKCFLKAPDYVKYLYRHNFYSLVDEAEDKDGKRYKSFSDWKRTNGNKSYDQTRWCIALSGGLLGAALLGHESWKEQDNGLVQDLFYTTLGFGLGFGCVFYLHILGPIPLFFFLDGKTKVIKRKIQKKQ